MVYDLGLDLMIWVWGGLWLVVVVFCVLCFDEVVWVCFGVGLSDVGWCFDVVGFGVGCWFSVVF